MIHIETILRGARTILKNAFAGHPYKLADITGAGNGLPLRLMLMSSSPGVLDGDQASFKVVLGAGSSLEFQTQSYQRLFTMKSSATQDMVVEMGEGAFLKYLPHPVVPHRNANFTARTKIALSPGCRLIWGEVLTCGRKLNGEIFTLTKYQSTTDIYRSGELVIRENLLLMPSRVNPLSIGQQEGYTHQATLWFLDEALDVKEAVVSARHWLDKVGGIEAGVTAAPVNGIVVRMLGNQAELLHESVQELADLLSNPREVSVAKEAICNPS